MASDLVMRPGSPDEKRVTPAEFCRLLTSSMPLSRCDDVPAKRRGLVRRDSGERYFVEADALASFVAQQPAPYGR